MDGSFEDPWTPEELASHIIVWHLVRDGAVRSAPLVQSFERQCRMLGPGHAAQHFAILALLARAAGPTPIN